LTNRFAGVSGGFDLLQKTTTGNYTVENFAGMVIKPRKWPEWTIANKAVAAAE
jgi:hypothetical protein